MSINSNTTPSLSKILWNANGLKNHANELYYFLHNKNIDLALISETHLTKNINFKINGYKIIRADHPDGTAHAGAAILIKSSILYTELQSTNKPYLQAANILINVNNCIPITISSVYFPPPKHNNAVSYQSQQISEPKLQSFFQKLGSSFIIGGDFNSKHISWGSRYTNTRGRILHNSILKNNITFISPDAPTYWPSHMNRLPDILDFFLTKIPRHLITHIKNLNELSSDHTPVLLTCGAVPEFNSR